MVLDAAVDPNVLSYSVPIIMKERGAVVGRGGARPRASVEAEPSPRGSVEAEPTPRGQARRSLYLVGWARRSLDFCRRVRGSLALGGRARRNRSSVVWARRNRSSVVRKNQRPMVTSTTSLGTPVLGPQHLAIKEPSSKGNKFGVLINKVTSAQ